MVRASDKPSDSKSVSIPAVIRAATAAAVLSLLAACSGHTPVVNQSHEAAQYAARARTDYARPGPPEDPWGPYINEASLRFDVPQRWIREVMRVESGGKLFQNGQLITSWVGAMGLMQVMPETYDELRNRYGLSDDAYDPHNNVLAGTAYMREMYDIYGMPGFLAAYNAGPKRLDDYLSNTRPLPDETRRYVAAIAPYIMDSRPVSRSPAEDYAMNDLPIDIPPGLRYGRPVQVGRSGAAERREHGRGRAVQVASRLPEPPRAPVQTAMAVEPSGRGKHGGFRIIPAAVAETLPPQRGGPVAGSWAVQVGAFADQGQAREAVGDAKQRAAPHGKSAVSSVRQGHGTLYRARLTGMSRSAAIEACQKLTRSRTNCIVLSPNSQS